MHSGSDRAKFADTQHLSIESSGDVPKLRKIHHFGNGPCLFREVFFLTELEVGLKV